MENKSQQRTALFQAIGFAWQFGYTIVVPLLIFGLGGRWLDRHYGTGPWLFLAGVLLSIVISSIGLVLKATKIMKSIDSASREPFRYTASRPEPDQRPEATPPPTPHHDNIPRR